MLKNGEGLYTVESEGNSDGIEQKDDVRGKVRVVNRPISKTGYLADLKVY